MTDGNVEKKPTMKKIQVPTKRGSQHMYIPMTGAPTEKTHGLGRKHQEKKNGSSPQGEEAVEHGLNNEDVTASKLVAD